MQTFRSQKLLHRVRTLSSCEELLTQHFHHHGQGGSGRLWIRNGYHVVVYDRSMKMDGPCALYRCMTDGKLENVSFFFWIFCPSRTFTCWGYVQFFDICSVYLYPSINITRINMYFTFEFDPYIVFTVHDPTFICNREQLL